MIEKANQNEEYHTDIVKQLETYKTLEQIKGLLEG